MEISGKVALVTGSSRGIGREVARELAAKGARVAVHYRVDCQAAQETPALLRAGRTPSSPRTWPTRTPRGASSRV